MLDRTPPQLDDLIYLAADERQELEARVRAEIKRRLRRNIRAALTLADPVEWIEQNFYDPQTVNTQSHDYSKARLLRLEDFQKRITRHIFTIDPRTGRFPYRTVVYSAPKKSGKSTMGAAYTSYFAANVEAPNAVYVLANDREQSAGRVYAFASPTLRKLGAQPEGKYKFHLQNGTLVQASTSDPEKEAGGSYGLTVWDELWAYRTERARLLFDELMPIATRNISMRLVVTYAGFEDSSDLLMQLYKMVFKDTTETELAVGARAIPSLADITTTNGKGETIPCCYEVPEIGMFYYNDHEQRMPWQRGERGQSLRRETTRLLTGANVYRLMENRWQVTENPFISPEALQASFKHSARIRSSKAGTFGVDAGWKKDSSALVGCYQLDGRYVTNYARCWTPEKDKPLDLQVLADEILRLWTAGLILRREPKTGEKKIVQDEGLRCIDVHYDPTQLHHLAMRLRKEHRLLMAEFDQKQQRLRADSFLLQQYNDFNLDNIDDVELQSHVEAAKAEIQNSDSNNPMVRIVKATGEHAKPIDLAVAQSMAVYMCSKRPKIVLPSGVIQGSAKGW